jgi:hypothetical protein
VPKVIILGSSNAVPSKDHENTHLVIIGEERTILVDCVSNPVVRLEQAGVDFNELTDIIITHFHPDHVSGVPLLLMDMWLMGRTKPINLWFALPWMLNLIFSDGEWPVFSSVFLSLKPNGLCDGLLTRSSSPVHHDSHWHPRGMQAGQRCLLFL